MNTRLNTIVTAALLLLFLLACSTAQPQTPQTPTPAEPSAPVTSEAAPAQEDQASNPDSSVTLADGTYTLDASRSTLTYTASRIAGTPHVGTVALKDGSLRVADGAVVGGTFTVDMTTITESKNNQRFLTHLASKDFFDVATHPTSTFSIQSAKSDGSNHTVTGDLTILNRTNEITFPAAIALENSTLRAQAAFTIDRTRWNITYDSGSIFSELGDRAINDEIGYQLDLAFTAP